MQPKSDSSTAIQHLIMGPLRSDTIFLPDRRVYTGLLGGFLAYAAAGLKVWSRRPLGLISRIGKNFPQLLLDQLSHTGWNTQGIHILPESQPVFGCYVVEDEFAYREAEPLQEYAKLGLPCPPELRGFRSPVADEEDTTILPAIAIRPGDVPGLYQGARMSLIGPCHLASQITLMVALRRMGITTIVLCPSERIMAPQYLRDFRILLLDVDVLFVREASILKLFRDETHEVRQMAEILASYGADIVILQRGMDGYSIYDSNAKRHRYIPAYPVNIRNPIGCGDAFCGGFLADWQSSYDPVESAMHGCVSASMALEGMGAAFSLERNPLLADARLQSLRHLIPDKYG
jgi:sugar/nucleoside kinase (ribokinase family)